jgi:hypothetical protein
MNLRYVLCQHSGLAIDAIGVKSESMKFHGYSGRVFPDG